jgi:hypothetical protein
MVFLVVLMMGIVLVAGPALAQSPSSNNAMRFGVGTALTRINDGLLGKTAFMPLGVLDFPQAEVEFGFSLRSGEDQTQFMMQVGGGYSPIDLGPGRIYFGGMFYLETDAIVINDDGNAAFTFGLFGEYRIPAAENLDIGVRVFPFQLTSSDNYSRIGLFAPGLTATFFF